MRAPVRDAVAVAVLSALLGLAVNVLRPSGIPLIAIEPYSILVPCPETLGEVQRIEARDLVLDLERDLLIDARGPVAFAQWHIDGAVRVPFDVLEPVAPDVVEALLKRNAQRVVVYGEVGVELDDGFELARELAGRGLRHVVSVRGGAAALRQWRGGEVSP